MKARYAVCNQRFHGLSVMDYAFMNLLLYQQPDVVPTFYRYFFGPRSVTPATQVHRMRSANMPGNRVQYLIFKSSITRRNYANCAW